MSVQYTLIGLKEKGKKNQQVFQCLALSFTLKKLQVLSLPCQRIWPKVLPKIKERVICISPFMLGKVQNEQTNKMTPS